MPIPKTRTTAAILALLLAASAGAPAAADPSRLEAIAELLAGQDPSVAPQAPSSGAAAEGSAASEAPPPVAAQGSPEAAVIAGPATLADLADYVRAKVPDTPARDPLAEACALAAKLNPGKPPHQNCKAK